MPTAATGAERDRPAAAGSGRQDRSAASRCGWPGTRSGDASPSEWVRCVDDPVAAGPSGAMARPVFRFPAKIVLGGSWELSRGMNDGAATWAQSRIVPRLPNRVWGAAMR
jgi:hypothetical protein